MSASKSSSEPLPVALTRQFYEWEQRGRGWSLWDSPVDLEPPFRPFFHKVPQLSSQTDDGRRHTWLSALWAFLAGRSPGAAEANPDHYVGDEPIWAAPRETDQLSQIRVVLSPDLDISKSV